MFSYGRRQQASLLTAFEIEMNNQTNNDNSYVSLKDYLKYKLLLIKYEKQIGKFCPSVHIFHNLFSLLD